MFFRKRDAPTGPIAVGSDDDVGVVLDALGTLLAAYVAGAHDLPPQSGVPDRESLHAWHRHATRGTPAPGSTGDGGALPVGARDWPALAAAIQAHRRHEHRWVSGTIGDLREALWGAVETVFRTATIEDAGDGEMSGELARARAALDTQDPGRLRDEVLSAIGRIEEVARSRREATVRERQRLAHTVDALGAQLEAARRESETDALTGLGNRKCFDVMLQRVHQLATIGGEGAALVLIDADGLKQVNDELGHAAGDTALRALAGCIARTFLRRSDVACRIGGDEFAVILPGADAAVAQRLAGRFVEALEAHGFEDARIAARFGASAGIATLRPRESPEAWTARADAALYEAKRDALRRVRTAAD